MMYQSNDVSFNHLADNILHPAQGCKNCPFEVILCVRLGGDALIFILGVGVNTSS